MSDSIQDNMKEQMDLARQALSRNLATIRAGRANPTLLDNVYVDYYGANTPLNQIAAITVPEARQLLITPYDKSALKEIEKAIQKADLGLSPSNDGKVIRINIPALTEDRRKDLVKVVGKYAEEAKVQVRNVRREANDKLKKAEKNSDISKDELKGSQENVQKTTDNYIEQIDQLAKDKEKEIMEV